MANLRSGLVLRNARNIMVENARITTFATLLLLWAFSIQAAQISTQFVVLINLNNEAALSNADLCRGSARVGVFGETVIVVCSSGESVAFSGDTTGLPWSPVQDGGYRFITYTPESDESLDEISSYAGVGTVTSWRVVNLSNRDYLELMIGW